MKSLKCFKSSVKRSICERLKDMPVGTQVTTMDFPEFADHAARVALSELVQSKHVRIHYEILRPIVIEEDLKEPIDTPKPTPLPISIVKMGTCDGLLRG